MGGLPLEIIKKQPPKWGPPLDFINIQPLKWGPPLEFINQMGSASKFHQPKGGPPLNFINQKGGPLLGTIANGADGIF